MLIRRPVLIFYDYFSPAYKAGGPIRSIDNLVKLLGKEINFYIYTTNNDLDGMVLDVEPDKWLDYEGLAKVFYASGGARNYKALKNLIREINPGLIYINGMFSMLCVIYPLLIARKSDLPVIVAPRGMLQSGALKLKAMKKKVYLSFLRLVLQKNNILWHATDETEQKDIRKSIGPNAAVSIAGNIPTYFPGLTSGQKHQVVKFVTVSLIARKKNIGQFISAILNIPGLIGNFEYHIYGPVKDAEYMKELNELITGANLDNIYFHGPLLPRDVPVELSKFDFFVLPTLGENFGHAIYEALGSGLPVIISDQTPWRNLKAQKAGWDVSLDDPEALKIAIEEAVEMSDEEYHQWSAGAKHLAERYVKEARLKEKYLEMFRD